ncbi:MAG: copper resistance protein NlpE [Bacteroidales bacterium]
MEVRSVYKVLFIGLISLFLVRCNYSQKEAITKIHPPDMHTSEISIDWQGTYKGVIPCADCAGNETEITLYQNKKYSIKNKYLGKDDHQVFEQTGRFSWDSAGSVIQLGSIKNGSKFYRVGENYLQQLDIKGNEIEGELADLYILKKVF